MATKTAPRQRPPLVRPTKHPEPQMRDALRQPLGGAMPSKGLIARARKAWGIEAVIAGKHLKAIKPKSGGNVVHAKLDAHHTLCTINTDEWAKGTLVVDAKDEPINCLWCLTRIKGR